MTGILLSHRSCKVVRVFGVYHSGNSHSGELVGLEDSNYSTIIRQESLPLFL